VEAIVVAAYRYLARTPSRIVMVQLEDALGETTPVNVPGTDREYPNWRRKLRVDVGTIGAHPGFAKLATALRELRPRT
jgi:4-alpha-glucanotransferase